ncbi:MAG: phytanoyl-CoA dioxygenase family protein [Bdellovibrionales bacterium]|nr:phytanoyl-CoA dioxygenase family protein [Bdellovibrionales bacterium]
MKLQTVYRAYGHIPASIRRTVAPVARACRPILQRAALSSSQKKFWDENGYLVLPGFFGEDVIDTLNLFVDELWNTRKRRPDLPFMVDFDHGKADQKRWPIHEVPDWGRQTIYKLNDLYLECPFVRLMVLNPVMSDMLNVLLDGEPVICNTLNLEWGSEQDYHFDTFYMAPQKQNKLVASWIALEDISEDAGPLKFVSGSHKIPPFIFPKSGTTVASHEEMPMVQEYIETEVAKRGLKEELFLGKKGDCLLWHAQLLHAGSKHRDRTKTRKSIVTHYWRWDDLPGADVRIDRNGTNWLYRHHQPRIR